jgi:hypothetical protein
MELAYLGLVGCGLVEDIKMFKKFISVKKIFRYIGLLSSIITSSAYGVTCPVGTPCSLSTLAAGTIRMNPSSVPYFTFKTVADIDTQLATYPYYRIKYRYNATNWGYITSCAARLATDASLARNTLDRVGYTTRLTTELSPAMGTTYAHKQTVTAYGFTSTPTTTATHSLTIWMDFFTDSGCATAAGLTSAGANGNFIVANNCAANVDATTNTSWASVIGGATETLGTSGHACVSGTATGTITRACSTSGVWGAVTGGGCAVNCSANSDATTLTAWGSTTGGTTVTLGSSSSYKCSSSSAFACTPTPTRSCAYNGTWGAINGKCAIPATCAQSFAGTSNCTFPETINDGCAAGISVSSFSAIGCWVNFTTPGTYRGTATCNTNGTWSGATCSCVAN